MLPLRRLAGAGHPEDSPTQGRSAPPNLPAGGRGPGTDKARPECPVGPCRTVVGEVPGSGQSPGLAARVQLVVGVVGRRVVVGPLARQQGELALDLAPHPADGDAEDSLAALDEVDDLVGRRALVDRGAVAHQGDLRQVLDAALAQVADGDTDLLERDPGVEQSLDDLEHEDVAEAVEALGAGAGRAANGRLDETRAGPVVELSVGDAGRLAGGRTA